MIEQCRNCRFSMTGGAYLFCRRYPPAPAPENDGRDGALPIVHPANWCGEWMSMRPGAGLPAGIAPQPKPKMGAARKVLLAESARRITGDRP